uniref:NADH-ubiquinone oxidoreductase chain 5 n=1 Tax=Wiebesia pumilae TaxID=150944 RepID=A0A8A3UXW8_9HYME|nr:NADH dehydrogenase subunit 5 [Wiebesia pumilae]
MYMYMYMYMYIIYFYLSSFMFLILSIMFFILGGMMLLMKYSLFMEWSIFTINSINIHMFIFLDWMSLLYMSVVMLISSSIMLYCNEYMKGDCNSNRFFFLIFFFLLSMMLMIISPNMVSILLGWDGLGLISYLLVIYYNSYNSYNSGMLTVLMNRVGDVFILMSIGLMMMYGSMNFMNMVMFDNWIYLFIIIAAFTKSAQFPFSSWLPAAMAAPTPVSALVHSSTLVTAGVYLLIRFNSMISLSMMSMNLIKVIGLLTMFLAGVSAIFSYDLKKIIAFSTLSQLGLMMMIYGMGKCELVFFHLIIHAIFKSLLFMCAGAIIHSLSGVQDIRMMGGIKYMMPVTYIIFIIANFASCGIPFMSGYYSKDLILEFMLISQINYLMKLFLLMSFMFTVIYTVRMSMFLSRSESYYISYKNCNESIVMNLSMILLFFFTLVMGMFLNWMIFMNIEEVFISQNDKIMFYLSMIISIVLGMLLSKYKMFKCEIITLFIKKMWFMNLITNKIIYYPLIFPKYYFNLYEKGWSEFMFKNLIYMMSMEMKKFNMLNNNYVVELLALVSFLSLLLMLM